MEDVVYLGSRETQGTRKENHRQSEARFLKNLSASLGTQARSATFACGGSVAFKSTENITMETFSDDTSERSLQLEVTAATAFTDDVQVRFGKSGVGVTLSFSKDGASLQELGQLLETCQPAPFGRGGETVLDAEYRKAGKLDRSEFATNFCPYESGIIDAISQLLVPQCKHDEHNRSIKAELYKLNVYSAPGGKFKPHVDTPRSKEQIGSLVVSLPSLHQGGQLVVSNAGAGAPSQNAVFDWSTTDNDQPAQIKWAAFYSDCQHEVHEVTSGHRVTLTYNLFLTRGIGHLAESAPALDATQLPLYKELQVALKSPHFLHRGNVLAAYLTHSYAHTHEETNFLPHSLKGADMSLWVAVKALGLKCHVVPVMSASGGRILFRGDFNDFEEWENDDWESDKKENTWGFKLPDSKVTWLGGKALAPEEAQMAYMAYGNQAELSVHYTRAAMLIRIPSFDERNAKSTPPRSFWAGINIDPTQDDPYVESDNFEHPLHTISSWSDAEDSDGERMW